MSRHAESICAATIKSASCSRVPGTDDLELSLFSCAKGISPSWYKCPCALGKISWCVQQTVFQTCTDPAFQGPQFFLGSAGHDDPNSSSRCVLLFRLYLIALSYFSFFSHGVFLQWLSPGKRPLTLCSPAWRPGGSTSLISSQAAGQRQPLPCSPAKLPGGRGMAA